MLAHAVEESDFAALTPEDFSAEWKWDGTRVQAVAGVGRDGASRRAFIREPEKTYPEASRS
jgi:DNA ligase-1